MKKWKLYLLDTEIYKIDVVKTFDIFFSFNFFFWKKLNIP